MDFSWELVRGDGKAWAVGGALSKSVINMSRAWQNSLNFKIKQKMMIKHFLCFKS